ncbi:hypothetical protein DYB34_011362, partial [Aphanomyces astaci]
TVFTVDCTFKETEFHRPRTVLVEDDDDQRDGRRGATMQATKEDIDMDPADTPLLPQHSASGTTSERSKSPPGRKTSPARLMGQPFGHYPPQITRHDTRNSRRITTTGATPVVAVAPAHEEEPRESRWDRSHRPSTKKQSTSPGRTKQTAMDGLDVARHAARATAVESKRSASRNKIRANATTAQPERKASDRGQSPHKTMRTEGTRGVATKVPWQHPIDQDDSSDAANAAYDVCFNATDVDEDVPATFREAMQSADATGWLEAPMTERYMYEQPNKLKADGSNYREWCVKTRAKINQQKLGKYLQPCYDPDGKYKSGLEMDDDLVALSYIQLSVHNDHLKYIQHVETTYDTWNALKAIYENTSEVSLVTLQMKMYKLDWSERIGLESFADQFQELTRKMTAAGDGTPERSHVTRFLCLLPPRFANTVSYITRESRDTTKFATMRSVLEELKLDDERQQLSNPSLRKNADKSDDALNATVNGECHYCHKAGHFRSECRRRQNDEAKGVQRRNVRDKPQGNGGGRGSYDGGRNGGRFSGRGRGRNGGNGRGGGRPNWRGADYGNYAEEDEMEDIFMIEEDLPVTSCPDDEDTWWQTDVDPAIEPETDDVSTELCQYATDETDECNAAAMYVREAIIDSGATAHMTGDIDLLHSVVACARGVRLADGHPIPVTAMGDLKIKSDETGRTATFKNVLYVPTLKKTLVSISRINRQSNDASLVFKKDHCQLRNKNKLSITARWNDSYLYAIQGKFILPGINDEANMAEAADAMLWHARMGHIPAGSMAAASKASIGGPTDLPKTITCED